MLARFIIVAFVLTGAGCNRYLALVEYQGRLYVAEEGPFEGDGRLLECQRGSDERASVLNCQRVTLVVRNPGFPGGPVPTPSSRPKSTGPKAGNGYDKTNGYDLDD